MWSSEENHPLSDKTHYTLSCLFLLMWVCFVTKDITHIASYTEMLKAEIKSGDKKEDGVLHSGLTETINSESTCY